MSDLIRALLNLSRIGRSNMNASTLNMEEIFNNIWADVKSESKGRKIKFVMGKLLGAFGDSTLIRQVVLQSPGQRRKIHCTKRGSRDQGWKLH